MCGWLSQQPFKTYLIHNHTKLGQKMRISTVKHFSKHYSTVLTNSKFSHIWGFSSLFNWIFYETFVVTFVTFLHTFNMKSAGFVCLVALEPRLSTVNVLAIFLPLELKVVSVCFNSKFNICSNECWLVIRMLSDLGEVSWYVVEIWSQYLSFHLQNAFKTPWL